jgi:uncharacterized protein YndB with AHSA1/START domain
MSSYLLTFRAPAGYAPSPDTFDAWSTWQAQLGARLKDRGNPGFAAAAIGAPAADTTLGGYSLIRAGSLDAAVALARGCPLLAQGGAVEICELSGHDARFDNWLDTKELVMTEITPVEVSMHLPGTPDEVFPYFTDPALYVRWMGSEATLQPVPGGVYRIQMSDGMANAGEFLEVEAPGRVAFSWGFADQEAATHTLHKPGEAANGEAMPPGSTLVTVTLDAEDGGTRLTLRHEKLPSPGLREGHEIAWNTYLPRLAIRLAGGDPGPDPHA